MPLVDVATAARELRLTLEPGEEEDLTRKLTAAQEQAAIYMGRAIYVDEAALQVAQVGAPAVLAAAATAFDDAMAAAAAFARATEREASERLAKDTYYEAYQAWSIVVRGIVLNDSIRTAILLTTGSLWEHRGDEDAVQGIPPAARNFLFPFRAGLGV